MNVFEQMIGWVAPERALRRARARLALDGVRAYESAKVGRRTAGWHATGASANAEIGPALARTRNRARDLARNNEYAAKAINTLASNVVGTGIIVQPESAAERKLWDGWTQSQLCDADGVLDFAGLQKLWSTSRYEAGEVLIRRRMRRASDGLVVPLQLQVLEADHLDETKTGPLPNGNVAILGVEHDAIGRRVAYWLYPQHPGEIAALPRGMQSVRVPASEIIHLFGKRRPSQVRGMPELATSLMRLRDLADYEDAELVRKKVEACFTAFVTTDDAGVSMGALQQGADAAAPKSERLAPGMIKYLRGGEDVKFGVPAPSAGYGDYTRTQLHAIAAGAGVTYEQLTGDLSQVNYSSLRAGLIEFRMMVDQHQWLEVVPMALRPIRAWFREAAQLAGHKVGDAPDKITMPARPWVDPLKDVMAEKEAIRGGLSTVSEALRQRGMDPQAVFAERAREIAELAQLGITTDSDAAVSELKTDPSVLLADKAH